MTLIWVARMPTRDSTSTNSGDMTAPLSMAMSVAVRWAIAAG
jgi:hypothetical protein